MLWSIFLFKGTPLMTPNLPVGPSSQRLYYLRSTLLGTKPCGPSSNPQQVLKENSGVHFLYLSLPPTLWVFLQYLGSNTIGFAGWNAICPLAMPLWSLCPFSLKSVTWLNLHWPPELATKLLWPRVAFVNLLWQWLCFLSSQALLPWLPSGQA